MRIRVWERTEKGRWRFRVPVGVDFETDAMQKDTSCPDPVNCALPECLAQGKCGYIQSFTNLSNCLVEFQYQEERGTLWHSLGQFGPGQRSELGGGLIMLPKESNLRAIRPLRPGESKALVIADWGRLGDSLPNLYVTGAQCSQAVGDSEKGAAQYAGAGEMCPVCAPNSGISASDSGSGDLPTGRVVVPVWLLVLLVFMILFAAIATWMLGRRLRAPGAIG